MCDEFSPFQTSDKGGDGIHLVRGRTYEEYVENLRVWTADPELPELLAAFGRAVKATVGQHAQAVGAAVRGLGAEVVSRATQPAPVAGGNAYCQFHGQPRERRTGTSSKTGRPYAGWYCPVTGCKPEWEKTG